MAEVVPRFSAFVLCLALSLHSAGVARNCHAEVLSMGALRACELTANSQVRILGLFSCISRLPFTSSRAYLTWRAAV